MNWRHVNGMMRRDWFWNLLLELEMVRSTMLLLERMGTQTENEITFEGWVHMKMRNLADGDWTGKLCEEVMIEFGTMILTPDVSIVKAHTKSSDALPDPP